MSSSSFCYWQIYKDSDFYLLTSIGIIALIVFAYTVREFIKIIKFFSKLDKKIVLIYTFCLFWSILYVTKIIYSAFQYQYELKNSSDENQIFQASQLYCTIDTLTTFFLMYLLILIPYFWLKNITNFLQTMKRSQKIDKIILKFYKIYIYFRILIYGFLITFQLSLSEQSVVQTLCDAIVQIILFQVFISLFLLCYGLIKLFRNFRSLNLNDEADKKKFTNQYLLMILCCFIRFAMDFYFIIYEKTQMTEKNCFQYRSSDYLYTTLYIVLGEPLMHLAPIIMILSIYRIDFNEFNRASFLKEVE